jgi:hypothetical protein
MVLVQEQIRIAILPNLKQLLQDRGALWHGSKASAYTSQMYSIGTNDVGDAQRNAMQCSSSRRSSSSSSDTTCDDWYASECLQLFQCFMNALCTDRHLNTQHSQTLGWLEIGSWCIVPICHDQQRDQR